MTLDIPTWVLSLAILFVLILFVIAVVAVAQWLKKPKAPRVPLPTQVKLAVDSSEGERKAKAEDEFKILKDALSQLGNLRGEISDLNQKTIAARTRGTPDVAKERELTAKQQLVSELETKVAAHRGYLRREYPEFWPKTA